MEQKKEKQKNFPSGNAPENLKSTEELLNSEMEAVEGGGVCVCPGGGAIQKTTAEKLEQQ